MFATSAPPYNGTHQGEVAENREVIVGWPARDRQYAHRRSNHYQSPEVHGPGFGMTTRPLSGHRKRAVAREDEGGRITKCGMDRQS